MGENEEIIGITMEEALSGALIAQAKLLETESDAAVIKSSADAVKALAGAITESRKTDAESALEEEKFAAEHELELEKLAVEQQLEADKLEVEKQFRWKEFLVDCARVGISAVQLIAMIAMWREGQSIDTKRFEELMKFQESGFFRKLEGTGQATKGVGNLFERMMRFFKS